MTHSSFSRKKAGLSDNLHPFDNNKASLLTSRSFADIDDASYDTANVYVGHGNMRTVQSIGLIDDINECLLKNNPSNNYNFNTINKHVSNDDFKNCFSRHSCKNSGEDNCSGTITNKGQGKLIVTLADLKVWLSDQQRTDNFRNYLKSNSICTWALDFYIASTGLCRLSPNDSQVKPLFKAIFRRYMKKIPQIKEEIFDNTISQPHYHSDSEQRPAKSAISTQMSSLSEHGDDNHNTIQSGHDVSVKFPIQGDTLFEINSRISNKNINSSIFNTARSDVLSWLLPYFVDFKKYTHSSVSTLNNIFINYFT
ncbi:hypothetical protein GJ496_001617 [Pomphorhynchus laevis]|nr:hypothetical protein GJ496_001617 [Pomphorhynchus laevis]